MQDENMEFKRQKVGSSENYAWTDYLSLPFTQNVSPKCLKQNINCVPIYSIISHSFYISFFIFYICHQQVFFFFFFLLKVISETLRMANIINAIWRKALKDVEIKGICLFLFKKNQK